MARHHGIRHLLFARASLALGVLYTDVAAAQSASGAGAANVQPAATTGTPALGDVIVQARRTNERLQAVPIAVTALSKTQLNRDVVTSAYDIQRLAPSIVIEPDASDGQEDFLIRGSFAGVGNDPSVVTYIDDVPQDSRTTAYDVYDIASIQELKGPQGTLFGRNSTGGAVLFAELDPERRLPAASQGSPANRDEKSGAWQGAPTPILPLIA